MFNSIVEKVIIVMLISIIMIGSYISFKANNTLDNIQEMYFDDPQNEQTNNIA
tara:strand:- start:547 stop:705 length:159 start_codon:yes stop_codon:yes gene_type:complete